MGEDYDNFTQSTDFKNSFPAMPALISKVVSGTKQNVNKGFRQPWSELSFVFNLLLTNELNTTVLAVL